MKKEEGKKSLKKICIVGLNDSNILLFVQLYCQVPCSQVDEHTLSMDTSQSHSLNQYVLA